MVTIDHGRPLKPPPDVPQRPYAPRVFLGAAAAAACQWWRPRLIIFKIPLKAVEENYKIVPFSNPDSLKRPKRRLIHNRRPHEDPEPLHRRRLWATNALPALCRANRKIPAKIPMRRRAFFNDNWKPLRMNSWCRCIRMIQKALITRGCQRTRLLRQLARRLPLGLVVEALPFRHLCRELLPLQWPIVPLVSIVMPRLPL